METAITGAAKSNELIQVPFAIVLGGGTLF
jgi:hypothetical protein